jgi:hypothetical protein
MALSQETTMNQQQLSLWLYGGARDDLRRRAASRRKGEFGRFLAAASKRLVEEAKALRQTNSFKPAR